MDGTRLLQYFDTLAETPDAVAKLRALVRDLAIRGRLVPQETKDDSFTGELALNNGSVEIQNIFTLPPKWKWVLLSQLAVLIRGVSYRKDQATKSLEPGYVPVLRANNIGKGLNFDDLVYVPRENVASEQLIKRNDVVIAMSSGSKNLVGKAAQAQSDFEGGFGAFCGLIRLVVKLHPAYFGLFLETPFYRERIAAAGKGIGINNLQKENLESLPIPIPPLAEQLRIVAKVEELLALCDELEAAQTAAREHRTRLIRSALDHLTSAPTEPEFRQHAAFVLQHSDLILDSVSNLRQAILALALKGQLTRQDPQDEPASELIRRIDNWRQDAIKNKRIRAPKCPLGAIELSEVPHELPTGWEWTRLGVVIYVHSGDGLTADAMIPDGIPVFGGNGVNGFHNAANVHKETIVIGRVGFYCGSIHVTPPKAWVTDNAFITEFCTDAIDRNFLTLLLRGTDLKKREDATAQPVISGGKIYPIVVALPPLTEQQRIVAKVDELMRWCDALEARLTAAQTTAATLLDATLHQILTK